ncbi:MAG: TIM barrel protein [Luteitalea sp.]|nr:TIM barrel protein [Luteitalea sp.]
MSTRRNFLLTSTLALPAAALLEAQHADAAQSAQPKRALKVGTVTYNIAKDWDLGTIITNLDEIGMEAVELRTTHKHGVELSLNPAERAEVRQRFEDSSVKLGGLGTTCEYHAKDPAIVQKNIEETRAWLVLAHDLGCPSIKVRPNGLRSDVPAEQTLEQIGKALATCGEAARDQDVRIQVEVHGEETARLPNIKKILDYAGDHPNVWICWNSNPTDLLDEGLEANFRLVQHKIGQVHMRDLYVEDYPWRRLVELLQEIDFDGYCFAELGESSCDGVRVLRYFRGMLRQLEGIIDPPLRSEASAG